jgi:hypothetical protein
MVRKVVSGGQTGVDRAALDVALALGIPCGGWCPRGRRAEDGRLPDRYPLQETPTADYPQRTAWNVRDSDGTLILHDGRLDRGTALTQRLAREAGRPHLVLDLGTAPLPEAWAWLDRHGLAALNVAGPRESRRPGIYERARRWLNELLAADARARRV